MTKDNSPKKEKKGFIDSIISRVDAKMKAKADEQARNSSCCSESNKKGGKCC